MGLRQTRQQTYRRAALVFGVIALLVLAYRMFAGSTPKVIELGQYPPLVPGDPRHATPWDSLSKAQNTLIMYWEPQLLGKKEGTANNAKTFIKADLPANHRIMTPGSVQATDFDPDRLFVHMNADGVVTRVEIGHL